VVVGGGAKVLGNLNIGDNVRIGAGSVVLRDVPSNCTVVGVPGRIVYRSGVRVGPLEHGSLPDSEAEVIRALVDRIDSLEQVVENLQRQLSESHLPKYYAESAESAVASSCRLQGREVQDFFDGSGI
jgi:serine O-acetyltransferase